GYAGGVELRSQLTEVVDLAVVSDDVATRPRRHGLVAFGRQVNDRKTPVTQCQARARIDPGARVIGASMRERVGHAFDDMGKRTRFHNSLSLQESAKTAHQRS